MVFLKFPAEVKCDASGCLKSFPVVLCLTGAGGFVPRPLSGAAGWEMALPNGNPGAPLVARCPDHVTLITPAPSLPNTRPPNAH